MITEHIGNDNNRQLTIEEQKQIELEILSHVIEFCEEKQINYFITYGSLLGAVRHKGFIPWDDDIDLFMLREEYEKFIDLYTKFNFSIYKIVSPRNEPEYPFSFIKIHDERTVLYEKNMIKSFNGVNIDIFPLDYVPKNNNKYLKYVRKIEFLHNLMGVKTRIRLKRKSVIKTILSDGIYLFLKVFSIATLRRKIEKLIQKSWKFEKEFVGSLTTNSYITKEKYPIEIFQEYCYLEFEDRLVRVPKQYDLVLKTIYGDYMRLPPEEKRIYRHGTIAFFKGNG